MSLHLSAKYRSILRYSLNRSNRKRLLNRDVSVISSNCIGSVILHELGLPFNSPTVNLFLMPEDFIRFVSDLERYCAMELTEVKPEEKLPYPVGALDDVCIHFMHYHSFAQAKATWERRVARINYSNLFFIMAQRDGCSDELVKQFDQLPYKNKVIFTNRPMPELKSAYYIDGTVCSGEVGDLCSYPSLFSGKRWIDEFDYVSFLNNGHLDENDSLHC